MVNIQRTTNGKEEHVKTVDCKGHNNDMIFLADQLTPYINTSVKFVVADGTSSGVLRIIEHRYPWYVALCVCAVIVKSARPARSFRLSTGFLTVISPISAGSLVNFLTSQNFWVVCSLRLLTTAVHAFRKSPPPLFHYGIVSAFRITGLLCGAHSIDLLIKDIVDMAWAKATVASVKKSIKFIKRHQKPLAIFKSKSGGKDLLLPKETRFGASAIMALRFKDVSLTCWFREVMIVSKLWFGGEYSSMYSGYLSQSEPYNGYGSIVPILPPSSSMPADISTSPGPEVL